MGIISTTLGPIRGVEHEHYETFFGIPYFFGGNMNDMWTECAELDAPAGELWDGMNRLAAKLKEEGLNPYLYYFAHALPGNDEGAFHSAELWYVFGTLHRSIHDLSINCKQVYWMQGINCKQVYWMQGINCGMMFLVSRETGR